MKYAFILAFIITFILAGDELGFSSSSPFYTHLTFQFQHAGIVHLLLNSIALIGIFHTLQKYSCASMVAALTFLSGFTASFLSEFDTPTIGASAMVYAGIGGYICLSLISPNIRISDTRKYLIFLCCVAVGLIISFFRSGSNFYIHLYALVFGFVLWLPIATGAFKCVCSRVKRILN